MGNQKASIQINKNTSEIEAIVSTCVHTEGHRRRGEVSSVIIEQDRKGQFSGWSCGEAAEKLPASSIINSRVYPVTINTKLETVYTRGKEQSPAPAPAEPWQDPTLWQTTPKPTCFKHFSFSFSTVVSSVTSSSHSAPSMVQMWIFNTFPANIFSSWTNIAAAVSGLRWRDERRGPFAPLVP